MTITAADLRAEAVSLTRHIVSRQPGGVRVVDGLGDDAVAFMFADADTIERYTRMAVAARIAFERNTEHRLDWLMDLEGLARDLRRSHDELRGQLTGFMALITEHMQAGEPGDDDVCASVKATLATLAALVGFDHGGWFDPPMPEEEGV